MARDAGEAFQSLVISRDNQIRGGGAPGRFFVLIEEQFVDAAKTWKDALKFAGKDTSVVDRSLARALDGTPKVPITRISQKPGQQDVFVGPGGQQVAPAIQNPQRFRPNAPVPVGPQEFLGTAAGPVPGTFNPAKKQQTPNIKIIRARDKDGNLVNVAFDVNTQTVLGPVGPVGPVVNAQPTDRPGRTELAALDEAEIGTSNAIQGAFKLRQAILAGGPEVLGAPGGLAGLAQGFVSQTLGFAQLVGVNIDLFESGASADEAGSKADSIFAEIDKAGTINAEIRSAIVNLAFAAAAASGQTGRGVSDRDYERFVRELGAGSSKPEVFASVLTKFAERLSNNFSTRFKIKMRRIQGKGKLVIPNLFKEIFEAPGASAAPAAGDQSRSAAGLPDGITATNPNTGETLVTRGGKWVEQ